MIKIENVEVFGWEAAIRGMRNPKNSWDRSDTIYGTHWVDIDGHECVDNDGFTIGPNDHKLMMTLAKAGTDHGKYRRMINVYLDITAPFYWWKEFDTYKVGTVANSCSTMHKIHERILRPDDFSLEHLTPASFRVFEETLDQLNKAIICYRDYGDKEDWWQIIQLLPTSYNQKRTVQLNYEVLANMYKSRKNHKLDEWHDFCDWIESLPYSEIITLKSPEEKEK